ncbi:hypothetical protein AB0K51_06920 [Kitasatospora sp. NPDC049285]|uniref:hypothetical protein n=1 Tax=Kitasatospora sp. NPDC049285 TaxID=3157096 RepID=UPI00341E682A
MTGGTTGTGGQAAGGLPPSPTATAADGGYRYTYALAEGYAINLGAHDPDHQRTTGEWTTQNFAWSGKDANGEDYLGIKGFPDSVTLLAPGADSSHQACRNSPRANGDPSAGGLGAGKRFCVFPGGFDALVTVVSNTATPGGSGGVLTLDVVVWE